jgi:hypothetical protein
MRVRSVLLVAAVTFVAGCTSGSRPSHVDSTQSSSASLGTVSGEFLEIGGPSPGVQQGLAGDIVFHLGSPTGHVVGSAVASSRGGFQATLPAGRYIVVGASPSLSDANCGGTSPVVVRAGATVHIQVVCPIP